MSKDYEMIHFIQERAKDVDTKIVNALTRMFSRLEERHCYASALSTSITLFLAIKFLQIEVEPKLILGTIQYQGVSYPHAWLEIDEKIFDLATYVDLKYHPVLQDRGLRLINPQINISYEDASKEICYYPFQFGETWVMANMSRLVGKTFAEYAENAPMFDIYVDVCYILEESEIPENTDFLKEVAKLETIKDYDENGDLDMDKL